MSRSQNADAILLSPQVIKMLLTIVIAFGLCWLPLHLFHILIEARPDLYDGVSEEQENAFLSSFIACHWLSMAHSCVNPIIYGFLHEKFRVSNTYDKLQALLSTRYGLQPVLHK